MGLDSVELIMENENFFNIEITDKIAENILTVQDLTDVISDILCISNNSKHLQDYIFKQLINAIKLNQKLEPFLSEKVSKYIPLGPVSFQIVDNKNVILNIPEMKDFPISQFGFLQKFRTLFKTGNEYDWKEIRMEEYVNAICFTNYQTLVNPNLIIDKFDIYTVVAGILSEKMGIDCFAIAPHKKFVDDYGIN